MMNLIALQKTLQLGDEVKNSIARISFFQVSKSVAIVSRFCPLDTSPKQRKCEENAIN
jgi:hypothetical protein